MGLPLLCSWGFTFCSPSCSYLTGFIKNKLYYLFVSSVFLLMTAWASTVSYTTSTVLLWTAAFSLTFPLLPTSLPVSNPGFSPPPSILLCHHFSSIQQLCVYNNTAHIYNPRVGCIGCACRTCSCAGDFVNEMNALLEMIHSNVLHR